MLVEGVWHLQKTMLAQDHYFPERTNLYEYLAQCASQNRDMAEHEDVPIVVDREIAGLPSVELDKRYFELVIFNLLDNAIKYSTPGTEIRINGRRFAEMVELHFTNIGLRIPPKEELDVTDLFVRTVEAQCAAPQSAGVGLYLVKRIVEGHKGSIHASSEPHGPNDFLARIVLQIPIKQ